MIYSKNEDAHESHLRLVLKVLKEHQISAKFRKREFWLWLVALLGHIIFGDGEEVDPKKKDTVKNWPRPLTPTYIRSFFGIAGYYRRFVDGFSSIASLLTTLIQKKVMF